MRFSIIRLGLAAAICTLAGFGHDAARAQAPALHWDGAIEHLSQLPQSGWSHFIEPARISRQPVSNDGRYIVFAADVPNDPYPPSTYVFRHDRSTGQTEMLTGLQAATPPVVSRDGLHVAQESCDAVWRPDGQPICDVYVIDLRTWSITIAGTRADGTLTDARSTDPSLSGSGRFVLFTTHSTTLVPAGAAPGQLMLRDRDADQNGIFDEPGTALLEVVSAAASGEPANAPASDAVLSDDGRWVAFRSTASNLVSGDTNNAADVFLKDRSTGAITRINVGWDGREATPSIDSPAISMSAAGDLVAFASDDDLTDPSAHGDDTNNSLDVIVYDAGAGSLSRVDVGAGGALGNGHSYWPSLSADGRYVSLVSAASNTGVDVTAGRAHVYVHDRFTGATSPASRATGGAEADQNSAYATLSGDGTFVVFRSTATNLAATAVGQDAVLGAGHFSIAPSALTIPARGGAASATVAAQQFVRWSTENFANWLRWETSPVGAGDAVITVRADANLEPAPRVHTFVVNGRPVTVTQEAGIHVTGISPSFGPMDGGTIVTLSGVSFEPDVRVFFDGLEAPVQFVDSTTLRATAPAHAPGETYVWVQTSDYRYAPFDVPFRYVDTTPPILEPFVEGVVGGGGWYTSDVRINWSIYDPETSFTSVSEGCGPTDITADTAGTTITCSVTSGGGTSTQSVVIRRDTTPPAILLSTPRATIYPGFSTQLADYACSDSASGAAACVGTLPDGQAIDTSTGYHTFTVRAADIAGNTSAHEVHYAGSSGECEVRPQGLVAWWPWETTVSGSPTPTFTDMVSGIDAQDVNINWRFGQGIVGSWAVSTANAESYVNAGPRPALEMSDALTLSAWIHPTVPSEIGVIAGREGEYLLARFPDGSIRWSLASASPGWGWINTGHIVGTWRWTHVALTYDGAFVRTFVNGQQVHAVEATGPIGDVNPALDDFRIGARQDPAAGSYLIGGIDDVMLLNRAQTADEIQRTFFAAERGLCVEKTVPVVHVTGGVHPYDGTPHAATASATGAGGIALGPLTITYNGSTDVPVNAGAYEVTASFAGDAHHAAASATTTLTIDKATPAVLVESASYTYDGAPHAAIGFVAGIPGTSLEPLTFTYNGSPASPVNAGRYAVVASYPGDSNYHAATGSATMTIEPAPLTVRAGDAVKRFGAPLPALSASFAGFVNGETAAALGGTLGLSTTATQQSAVGTYPIAVFGLTSPNYAITFVAGTLTVVRGAVTVSASAAPDPLGFNMPVTLTATVGAAAPAAGAPHGLVEFFDGSTLIGSAPLISGAASISTAGLDSGTRAIQARYAGDESFEAGTGTSSLVVFTEAATPGVAVRSSRNPSNIGQAIALEADVAGGATGSVQFYSGMTLIGTSPVSAGRATLTISSLAGGSHAITALYTGDATRPASRSDIFVQAVGSGGSWKNRSSSAALSVTPNPSDAGGAVTISAEVTGSSNQMPTGRILIMVDGVAAGDPSGLQVTLLSGRTAGVSVVVPGLNYGNHTITATYLGDGIYRGSTARVFQRVN